MNTARLFSAIALVALFDSGCRGSTRASQPISAPAAIGGTAHLTNSVADAATDAEAPVVTTEMPEPDPDGGAFPPRGAWIVADATPSCWKLHAWPALGKIVVLATRRMPGLVDTPPDPSTRVYVVADGVCRREPGIERGLPVIGALDLNLEPDRFFGVRAHTRVVTMRNYHLGDREVVALGGVDRKSLWLVTSRHHAGIEAMGVSDYLTWSGGAWHSQAATKRRGLNWPFATEAGDSVFVAERDAYSALSEEQNRTRWRIRRLRGDGPEPLLAPGFDVGRCAHSRVTGLYGFANGDLLATGVTCQDRLLLERWPSGSATSVAHEIAEIPTDKSGGGYYIDVVNSSLARARRIGGAAVTLTFDGTWAPADDRTPLRQDQLVREIYRASPGVLVDEAKVLGDHTFVIGARGTHSFVLSDLEVVTPCHLVLPGT